MDIKNSNLSQEPKEKTSKIVFGLLFLVIILTAASFYYFFTQQQSSEENIPPVLKISTSTLQGKAGDIEMYFEFDKNYVTRYDRPTWTNDLKPKDYESNQRIVKSEPEVNYFYFEKDKTIDQIISNIVPKDGGAVFLAVHNPAENLCVKGEAGFHTYKKGPYKDSTLITNTTTKVKAYCPVMVKSKNETIIWGAKNQKDPVDQAIFRDLIHYNYKDIAGWALVPLPKNGNLFEMVKKSSKGKALSITEMVDKKFDGNDFDYEKMNDLEGNKANKDAYLAWIYFGNTAKCAENQYLSGKTCKNCPNANFDDRECNSEKAAKNEIAKWHLDEGTGNLVFDSIGFNDGVIKNGQWVNGINRKAVKFNGEDSSIEIDPNSFAIRSKNALSIEVWAKADDSLSGTVVKKGNHKITYDEYKGWRVTFRVGNKNFTVDWESIVLPKKNEWYHIVGTFDNNKITIYVNGEEMNSLKKEGALDQTEDKIYIGSGPEESHFKGEIDEVAFYNKALSPQEVKELYEKYAKD